MKRYIAIILTLLITLVMAACGNGVKGGNGGTAQDRETLQPNNGSEAESGQEPKAETESGAGREAEPEPGLETGQEPGSREEAEENDMETNRITIKVGESTLTAVLEDNESAEALKGLLADEPFTIPASNYGGFEKVCPLGTELPRNDSQITTQAGDICLYSGNQIVIFYGSNSWAYTRLGKVADADASELEKILSGEETEITLSLEAFR